MPDTKYCLSVIICSRNRGESLYRCLSAIDSQDLVHVNGELILVNNDSNDQTLQIMQEHQKTSPSPTKVITVTPPGLGNARNAGIKISSGEILCFTDDDCYLTPGYFSKVIKVFGTQKFDYCGGRILRYDPSDSLYSCNESKFFKIFPPYSLASALDDSGIQGANMVIHRKVFDKVGGFNAKFGAGNPFRCEDLEFCTRASFSGFIGAYVPELVVYHHHGRKPGIDIENLKRANHYGIGAYYAAFILQGRIAFFFHWLRTRKQKDSKIVHVELSGAFHYVLTQIRNLFALEKK